MLGMTPGQVLRKVRLPFLAALVIKAGVRTSAVINARADWGSRL